MRLNKIKKRYYILVLLLISFIGFYNYIYTSCPKLNPDYFEWFPYHEDDVMIFKSTNKKEIKLKVSYLEVNHTSSYNKFVKCGHCEDYIHIIFVNEKDTLDVTMNNLDNPKSYFGYELNLYSNSERVNHIEKDSIIDNKKHKIISSEKYLFIKSKGLMKIKINGDFYFFKNLVRINKERDSFKNGC
jgi:hypothetical protein